MKIIAIDPGFERVGIAVLEKSTQGGKEILLYSDCFKTKINISLNERIFLIGREIEIIIKKFKPEALCIEKLFFNTNQKTVMGVSEARGVIIYEASRHNLSIFEYTPLQVKIAVTGYGKATKNQVMDMTRKLIKIEKKTTSDDELDAVAIGLTHLATSRF